MPRESLLVPACGNFPQPDRLVGATTDEGFAIGTERDTGDLTPMPRESLLVSTRGNFPQFDRLVPNTMIGESAAIRTERNRIDGKHIPHVGLLAEGLLVPTCGNFPQPDRLVGATTGESAAIRTERNGIDGIRMSREGVFACVFLFSHPGRRRSWIPAKNLYLRRSYHQD